MFFSSSATSCKNLYSGELLHCACNARLRAATISGCTPAVYKSIVLACIVTFLFTVVAAIVDCPAPVRTTTSLLVTTLPALLCSSIDFFAVLTIRNASSYASWASARAASAAARSRRVALLEKFSARLRFLSASVSLIFASFAVVLSSLIKLSARKSTVSLPRSVMAGC